ncbi:MarR family winged helix-turn-helix transcriptional regulator [Microbacterium sp. SORGH_AS_0888]|uniref:MarR family winged helix-turn-helix transcriptional regulator n=1 Tax=Microbacterium sp. SORGH_AS_0888 TaxID=3041791 RepID=UPI00277F4E1E|nr:MarR family transcriptional regulator [Microbacterium sp. SORGH_AS_0888]MDQ1130415.1 DNA-binding MarR family transcriptional regulator [Microbacterium sp. SORGH_AS_0888]
MWIEIEARADAHAEDRGLRVMDTLNRVQRAERDLRARSARVMGVTESEVHALRFVVRAQGAGDAVTPTDLANYLGARSTAVTLMVDHLEAAGHLVRLPHPSDRRSVVLVATEEAVARVTEIFGDVYETMMSLAGGLDDDAADRVVDFLSRLAETLDSFAAEDAES